MKRDKLNLGILSAIALTDYLGLSLVLTLFAPMLVDKHPIFLVTHSEHIRLVVLGFLLASFPFAAFFGAPFWGGVSDSKGRRPILLLTLFLSAISYGLAMLAVAESNLLAMFIARLLGGFAAGNVTVAQSSVADFTTEESRASNMSVVTTCVGLGFLLGPLLGAYSTHITANAVTNYTLAFAAIGGVFLILFFLSLLALPEFLKHKSASHKNILFNLLNIFHGFKQKTLFAFLMIWLCVVVAINAMQFNLSAFMLKALALSVSSVGLHFSTLAIGFVVGSGVVAPLLLKRFKASLIAIIASALILFTVVTALVAFNSNHGLLYLLLFIWGLCNGLFYAGYIPYLSHKAPADQQGKIIGSLWSLNSLTQFILPALSGYLLAISYRVPIVLAAIFFLIAFLFFVFKVKKSG